MQIAFYKGPATGLVNKIGRLLVCLGTLSRYSHCELVVQGVCYSASARDGGVRGKVIDLGSGHWDVVDVPGDEVAALAWFERHQGDHYDWMGVLRFALPFLRQRPGKWFCSEAVAEALGVADSAGVSPGDLWEVYASCAEGIPR